LIYPEEFSLKILIAEDNKVLQKSISSLMKKWGFEFDIANNGMEAVSMALSRNGKYDLCLMDIDMPIMDGTEATKLIRKTPLGLPIMAVTANIGYETKYKSNGMNDFLAKPYRPRQLFQKIQKLKFNSYTSKNLQLLS
jgi:CheY-like chemotaxis protein